MLKKKTSEDYHALAEERGFEWLGLWVLDDITKTTWRCSEGHVWELSYDLFQQWKICPTCERLKVKDNNVHYNHELAARLGIYWLGQGDWCEKWKCKKGHVWQATASYVLLNGCPNCLPYQGRKTPEDYHALAKERGFVWIGPVVQNVATKTRWECGNRHTWEATYNNIQAGWGCPICVDKVNGYSVSKPQRRLCEMVNGELNYPCGRKTIDVALPDEKIAIEYDSWYWHGDNLESDARRDKDLLIAGWRILHIKSNTQLPRLEQIDGALNSLRQGERITNIVLDDWGHGETFADVRSSST